MSSPGPTWCFVHFLYNCGCGLPPPPSVPFNPGDQVWVEGRSRRHVVRVCSPTLHIVTFLGESPLMIAHADALTLADDLTPGATVVIDVPDDIEDSHQGYRGLPKEYFRRIRTYNGRAVTLIPERPDNKWDHFDDEKTLVMPTWRIATPEFRDGLEMVVPVTFMRNGAPKPQDRDFDGFCCPADHPEFNFYCGRFRFHSFACKQKGYMP